jgi:hypothetical protein
MRIRITAGGIYGADGELPVGTELDITGPIPEGWVARCEVVQDAPAAPLTADNTEPTEPTVPTESTIPTEPTEPTMPLPTSKGSK